MKQSLIILTLSLAFSISACSQNTTDSQLLVNIKNSIKRQYTSWVVFANGTYVVITADSSTPDLRTRAIEILKDFGNTEGKKLSQSDLVISLKDIDGWIVDSPFQGLYTYVSRLELKNNSILYPKDSDITLLAISKRKKDFTDRNVIATSY